MNALTVDTDFRHLSFTSNKTNDIQHREENGSRKTATIFAPDSYETKQYDKRKFPHRCLKKKILVLY